jgi:AcrR family transcriptional regulator
VSDLRREAADATKERVLKAAKTLFSRHGIDAVTIAQIAEKARVSVPTVYAICKSKEGILRQLMSAALFGERFERALARLDGVDDPVRLIALTAEVARAVYEGESSELGLLRGATGFSPALRKLEQEFEETRFDMQEDRVRRLFAESKQKEGLDLDEARRLLWMYTSRDVYRMLVHESGWSADRYGKWLEKTLVNALVSPRHAGTSAPPVRQTRASD